MAFLPIVDFENLDGHRDVTVHYMEISLGANRPVHGKYLLENISTKMRSRTGANKKELCKTRAFESSFATLLADLKREVERDYQPRTIP